MLTLMQVAPGWATVPTSSVHKYWIVFLKQKTALSNTLLWIFVPEALILLYSESLRYDC